MSNAYDRIVDRILRHLESAGRSPVDRSSLLRVTATLGDPPVAVSRALHLLIVRGYVRCVRNLYMRVPSGPKPEGRMRSAG